MQALCRIRCVLSVLAGFGFGGVFGSGSALCRGGAAEGFHDCFRRRENAADLADGRIHGFVQKTTYTLYAVERAGGHAVHALRMAADAVVDFVCGCADLARLLVGDAGYLL